MIGFLRAAVAVLHMDLRTTAGEGYSNKALAHVLFALGELRVPFETVYPLVLQICDLLQSRVHTMDVTCAPLLSERGPAPAGVRSHHGTPGSEGLLCPQRCTRARPADQG